MVWRRRASDILTRTSHFALVEVEIETFAGVVLGNGRALATQYLDSVVFELIRAARVVCRVLAVAARCKILAAQVFLCPNVAVVIPFSCLALRRGAFAACALVVAAGEASGVAVFFSRAGPLGRLRESYLARPASLQLRPPLFFLPGGENSWKNEENLFSLPGGGKPRGAPPVT